MADLAPGEMFGEFRVERLIAHGGMGLVYKAWQERLGRSVALKVIAPHLALDEGFRERFRREAQMAAAIDHPNILPIYDAGEVDGQPYLAMRFVDGTDLRTVIDTQSPLVPQRVVGIVEQVAQALDAAHARGLVHRDIKPGNVLINAGLGRREVIYLTDFGLTRGRSDTRLTQTGAWIGTVDYMAPEQFESTGPADERVDQYSLACMAYEALTGKRPFERETDVQVMFAHIRDEPPSPSGARPDLPVGVDGVVRRGMAKRPGDRFATCSEFAAALRGAVSAGGAPAVAAVPAALVDGSVAAPTVPSDTALTARPRKHVHPAAIGGGVAAVAIGVVAAIVAATGGGTGSPTTGETGRTDSTSQTTTTTQTTTPTQTQATNPDGGFPPTTGAGVLALLDQDVRGAIIYDAATGGDRGKLRVARDGDNYGVLYRTSAQEVRTLSVAGALQWACLRQGKGSTFCLRASTMTAATRRSLEKSLNAFRDVLSNDNLRTVFTPLAVVGEVFPSQQIERQVVCLQAKQTGQQARLCTTRAGFVTEVVANTGGKSYVLRATSLVPSITATEFSPPARLR